MKKDIVLLSVGVLALAGAAVGGFYYWETATPQISVKGDSEENGGVSQKMPAPGYEGRVDEMLVNLQFTAFREGSDGGRDKKGNVVAKSEADLRSAIDIAGLSGIDFRNEMAVAVFSGTKPTGGYSVKITEVIETNSEIKVRALETAPGPGCVVTQALTSPYAIVKIQKSEKPVTFTVESETKDCN